MGPGALQTGDLILGALVLAQTITISWLLVLRSRERWQLAALRERATALEHDLDAALRLRSPANPAERAVRGVLRTAKLVREQGITGLVQSTVDDLTAWATAERADILDLAGTDGTVTLLFSDIQGSTQLNDGMGDATWVKVLGAHDRIMRGRVTQERGKVVKTAGDGYMVAFRDPAAACRAAVRIQRDLARSMDPALRRHGPIRVRIGIHSGQVVARDGDYFGRNVAVAARVADLASGGESLVSDAVRDALAARGDADQMLELVGETELRGLAGLHRIWRLVGKSASPRP